MASNFEQYRQQVWDRLKQPEVGYIGGLAALVVLAKAGETLGHQHYEMGVGLTIGGFALGLLAHPSISEMAKDTE